MKQNKFLPLLTASILFTSPVQSIGISAPSAALTIAVQDPVSQTGCISLATNSETGQFSSSKTSWNPVTVLTMNKGTSNRSFYYKDSTAGTYTLSATFALKPSSVTDSCAAWPQAQWASASHATQSITVGTGGAQQTATTSNTKTQTIPTASVGTETLTIKITSQPVVVVGAGSLFSSAALNSRGGVGSDTRYIWNFGDGAVQEGQNVMHTYTYPGTYNVMLSASSGDRAGIGRVTVQAVSAHIGMLVQDDGSVLISNNSSQELNIGLWNISSGMNSFQIPLDTIIDAGQSIRFSTDVMHMVAKSDVVLKYPNNFVASTTILSQESGLPKSGGGSAVEETPQRVVRSAGTPTGQARLGYPETAAAAEASTGPVVLWPYVLGTLGLILISVGLFLKKNPMKKVTNRALDEFDIEG